MPSIWSNIRKNGMENSPALEGMQDNLHGVTYSNPFPVCSQEGERELGLADVLRLPCIVEHRRQDPTSLTSGWSASVEERRICHTAHR